MIANILQTMQFSRVVFIVNSYIAFSETIEVPCLKYKDVFPNDKKKQIPIPKNNKIVGGERAR